MGFDVHVLVTLKKAPNEALMTVLDDKFEAATHEVGTKTVQIVEHVAVDDEADAVAFVRSLVLEAIPQGAIISDVTVTAD